MSFVTEQLQDIKMSKRTWKITDTVRRKIEIEFIAKILQTTSQGIRKRMQRKEIVDPLEFYNSLKI